MLAAAHDRQEGAGLLDRTFFAPARCFGQQAGLGKMAHLRSLFWSVVAIKLARVGLE